MLGGLETGDRAALLLNGVSGVNVLAVDWPWDGPRRMSGVEIVRQVPAIRAAVLRTPAPLANGIEAIVRERLADSTRIALIGVSLGVPPALAALRLTSRPSALILVHGAADLEFVLRHDLATYVRPRWLAGPIAALVFRLIRPLEPSLHFDAATRLPVLLVQAKDDDRLPPEAVDRLAAGFPTAEVQVLEGPHLRPTSAGLIATIADRAMAWLSRIHVTGTARPGV
jgi:pimeloyl-ACP methyl ester carboxylesterase